MFMIRVQHRWCVAMTVRRVSAMKSLSRRCRAPTSCPSARWPSERTCCARCVDRTFACCKSRLHLTGPATCPCFGRSSAPQSVSVPQPTQSLSMRGGSPRRSRRRTRTFMQCWPTMCDEMMTACTNQPKTGYRGSSARSSQAANFRRMLQQTHLVSPAARLRADCAIAAPLSGPCSMMPGMSRHAACCSRRPFPSRRSRLGWATRIPRLSRELSAVGAVHRRGAGRLRIARSSCHSRRWSG